MPVQKKPILSFNNVNAQYGAIQALHNVSLTVFAGEIVALIGANGAGKSTLLLTIFSKPSISAGTIFFKNQPIHALPVHAVAKFGISLAPEGRRIFPKMTTLENLELGALHNHDKKRFTRNLQKIFTLFPILFTRKKQNAGTLSGGEQQMLAIGRALMAEPILLLLDEPSLGLAPQITHQIFDILKEINDQGTTLFLVEQNAVSALTLAHRGYVLTNGQITLEGKASELLHHDKVQSAYLGSKIE